MIYTRCLLLGFVFVGCAEEMTSFSDGGFTTDSAMLSDDASVLARDASSADEVDSASSTTDSGSETTADAGEVSVYCAHQGQISAPECEALRALFLNTNGDSWTENSDWLDEERGPCDWYGVICESGHVVNIHLDENGLEGILPAELGNLAYLQRLTLHRNRLSGSIPAELGRLSQLQWLFLSRNQLSGNLPVELEDLESIKQLHLQGNQLEGEIPFSAVFLERLDWIRLSGNGCLTAPDGETETLLNEMDSYWNDGCR